MSETSPTEHPSLRSIVPKSSQPVPNLFNRSSVNFEIGERFNFEIGQVLCTNERCKFFSIEKR